MATYIIVGAGGFGLFTALNIRKLDKYATIKIIDKDKLNSASVNGGNGITNITPSPKNIFNFISFTKYKKPVYFNKIKLEWFTIYLINNLFNNKKNRDKIYKLAGSNNDYYKPDYWDSIYKSCEENKIEIIQDNITEYHNKDNRIILNDKYICDKLILATGSDLSLVDKYYHDYIGIFSGVAAIVKVKNVPKEFYFANDIFVTPYKDNTVKITCLLQFGDDIKVDREKIETYLKNNEEIKKLEFIELLDVWEGKRAMTYDTLPFYTKLKKDVYWISGGSFLGTHLSELYGTKLANYIIYDYNNKFYKLKRLSNIRMKYYFVLILIVFLIILFLNLYNEHN